MKRRDDGATPGTIVRLALEGYGVDDIHVRTGWRYGEIAWALEKYATLAPLAQIARKRQRRAVA